MEILTLSDYLKARYGQKIYKISLASGCTCPNRDGTLGTGGCTFCSAGGSGEFAEPAPGEAEIEAAVSAAERRVAGKLPGNLPAEQRKYIAYFQAYTNTYGDTDRLYAVYRKVLLRPDIVILSLGTRPDCLEADKMRMLERLSTLKPVWVELGLQTIHDETARKIHRGYPTSVFADCYRRLKAAGLPVIVHVILGLPGENREDMLDTIRYLAELDPPLDGIKIQMLNILEGSQMAEEYKKKPFPQMSMEAYCDLVVDALKLLPRDTVIHRMTGDGPKNLLISPAWAADKKRVLGTLQQKIRKAKEVRI